MEFGRTTAAELKSIKFKLPPDSAFNRKVLTGKPKKNFKLFIGCAKWGRPEWEGKLYPVGTKEKNYLELYIQHYNSIELNATHYKIYGPAATKKWAAKTKGKEFLFCPKMHQGITHRGKLGAKPFLLNEFLRGIRGFDKHLGPVFLQVNETFSPKRKDELFQFLNGLPNDIQFFLELRHPAWFEKGEIRDELFETLRHMKIGAVITDTAGRRDCVHMQLPISKAFIRFTGNNLHETDYIRVDAWVSRMKSWRKKGINEIYFFMHMHDETFSPDLAQYVKEQMEL